MQGCLTLEVQLKYTKDAYFGPRPWWKKGEDLQFSRRHKAAYFIRKGEDAVSLRCVVAQLYQQPQSVSNSTNYKFVIEINYFHFPLAFGALFKVHGFGLSSVTEGLSIF